MNSLNSNITLDYHDNINPMILRYRKERVFKLEFINPEKLNIYISVQRCSDNIYITYY